MPQPGGRCAPGFTTPSFIRTNPSWMTQATDRSTPWRTIAVVRARAAELVRIWPLVRIRPSTGDSRRLRAPGRALSVPRVRCDPTGVSDTTQDADLYFEKSPANGAALVVALDALGFVLDDVRRAEIKRGKDFVRSRTAHSISISCSRRMASSGSARVGPSGPDRRVPGVPSLRHHREQQQSPRIESLPRLRAFMDYWLEKDRR